MRLDGAGADPEARADLVVRGSVDDQATIAAVPSRTRFEYAWIAYADIALGFRDAFGVAFWLGLTMHAFAAELWLRWRPAPDARPVRTA